MRLLDGIKALFSASPVAVVFPAEPSLAPASVSTLAVSSASASSASTGISTLAPPLLTDRMLVASGRAYKPEDVVAMWSQAEKGDPRRYYAFTNEARSRDAHLDAELSKAEAFVTEARREILAYPPELREEEMVGTAEGKRAAEIAAYVRSQMLSPDVDLDAALRALLGADWCGLAGLEVIVAPGGDPVTGLEKLTALTEIPAQRFTELPQTTEIGLQQGADKAKLTPVASLGDSVAVYVPEVANPNPARRGIFRRLLPLWLIRNSAIRWWSRSVELFGTPPRVAKIAPGDEETEKKLAASLDAFGNANWIIIPSTADLDIKEAMTAQGAHKDLLEHTAREITKCVHGGTQTTQIEKDTGSKQSADTMLDIALKIANSRARRAANFLRRTVMRGLVARNFSEEDAIAYTPELVIYVEGDEDLLNISIALKNLSDAQVPYPVSWAYGLLGGIKVREGEEMVEKTPAPSPFGPLGDGDAPEGDQPVTPGKKTPPPPETAATVSRFQTRAEREKRKLEDRALSLAEQFEAGGEIVFPFRDVIRRAVEEGASLQQIWSRVRHRSQMGIETPELEALLAATTLEAMASGFSGGRKK